MGSARQGFLMVFLLLLLLRAWLFLLSRRKVYSILYSSTLILPSNRRGGVC